MCGRLDQNDISRLIRNFGWADEIFNRSQAEDKFNVSPGMYRPVMHMEDGELFVDDFHWGYRSSWAEASGKIPVAVNTRIEKISNRYWCGLLKRGRAIVPANGWYEWTGQKGSKQPWHVHRSDGSAAWIAALARCGSSSDAPAANGFTLITADACGGMVDASDRRPVVLSASDAALWLDQDTSSDEAEHILRTGLLSRDYFEWHAVDKTLGNVRMQGSSVARPIVEAGSERL